MTLHWAVQTNLGKSESEKLIKAFQQVGCPFTGLTCIPFSFRPLPELPTDRPTIFYGSVGFIQPIWVSQRWNPGVIFNENFDYRCWNQKWKEHCLNNGAEITTIEGLSKQNRSPKDLLFIRPCADDKAFTGTVIEFGEMESWMRGILGAAPDFKDTKIAVSEPVGITTEWRLYMLNGKVMSGSQYRKNFKSIRSPYVPQTVIEFGERMAAIWSPAVLFTLDIAESGGDLYVNEMGSFHSAGLYEADVVKIVSEINNFFDKL